MVRAIVVCLVALLAAPRAVRADERTDLVAVLPLVPSDRSLEIYGKPVADAVVAKLRGSLEMRIERVSLSSPPSHATLVVDGRILAGDADRISLEASVRDPSRGTSAGRVATEARPLTEIDALADELADKLGPLLRRAARRRGRVGGAIRLPATVVRVGDSGPEPGPGGEPPTSTGDRNALLVLEARGHGIPAGVDVGAVATPAAYSLVERLGRRAVAPSAQLASRVSVSRSELQAWLRRGQAGYALVTELRSVQFLWQSLVLTARGEVRIVLVGTRGQPLYDKTISTGTLVGSRGDRHAALVRFVTEQALDMAYPELKRILAR